MFQNALQNRKTRFSRNYFFQKIQRRFLKFYFPGKLISWKQTMKSSTHRWRLFWPIILLEVPLTVSLDTNDSFFLLLIAIIYFPVNITFSGIISSSCKIIMPSLLESLRKASMNLSANKSDTGVIQAKDVLISLKALCTGALEMNDTDFELLENRLKAMNVAGDSCRFH